MRKRTLVRVAGRLLLPVAFFAGRRTQAGWCVWLAAWALPEGHKRVALTSDKLNSYLANIDQQEQEMYLRLVEQMAEGEGITEKLKAEN